ncbi:bestrophin-like domain [Hamadaea tsunoensis]|uniref:bestrophin-like domain n=1 Tax=Hamadaea tsunoensis TaxID=53368 RepID=UPI0003F77F0E|nr:DUF4239 domain-containing protein [Hamadaea tsunoensis]
MSSLFAGVLIIVGSAVCAVLGFLVITKIVPQRWLVADSGVASSLYATIGMVYAILIAIAAIAVWEPRDAAASNVDTEATGMVEAYWAANGLAPADRSAVRESILAYLRQAAGPEWLSLHDTRQPTAGATTAFTRLRERVDTIDPKTDREQGAYDSVTSQISTAAGARRSRLAAAGEGMPTLLWPILILGGLISVTFLYMFGLERTFPNALMLAVVGAMVALLLIVIYQVEYPFSRAFAVGPGSFETAISQLRDAPATS